MNFEDLNQLTDINLTKILNPNNKYLRTQKDIIDSLEDK